MIVKQALIFFWDGKRCYARESRGGKNAKINRGLCCGG